MPRSPLLASALAGLVAAGLLSPAATAAQAAGPAYEFEIVADSVEDRFDPFNTGCASINTAGDIGFRAGRVAPDGFNTVDGIYRADAGSEGLVTIAEHEDRLQSIGNNPSMNDAGQVSFAASLERDGEAILRGAGGPLTVIARTEPGRFNFFGFDTSVNDEGRVAFKAELDRSDGFDEGLFSGAGNAVATHYRASTSKFDGSDSRPAINDPGDIAFTESVNFDDGVFVTRRAGFRTVSPPDPEVGVGRPELNNLGVLAFERSCSDPATDEFVTQIVSGRGAPFEIQASTRGRFSFFGFRPPAINNSGIVAFHGTLDDFNTSGVYVGPRPARPVVRTGDVIDGDPVSNVVFCEEGINDSGQLAFVATLNDPEAPDGTRIVWVRATPTAG
ncbi:MAG: hypothetical protein M3353_04265 [Actinomycetota bacterium]|nr:hypothetical protein [Actinomycetota bacterium]